jgi:uncharacterized membrane-anchored protein
MPILGEARRKIPEVTMYFWIAMVFTSGLGETFADTLTTDWHVEVPDAIWLTADKLLIAVIVQLALRSYVPAVYWLVATLASTIATLFTDYLTNSVGMPLMAAGAALGAMLIVVFACWHVIAHTVSVDSVTPGSREVLFWIAIFGAFALGGLLTDFLTRHVGVGYLASALIIGAIICGVAAVYFGTNRCETTAFWLVCVLTRALGVVLGDFLSQDSTIGGVSIGATAASLLIAIVMVGLIWFLTASKVDQPVAQFDKRGATPTRLGGTAAR